ncbi:MAG: helix-turn-helix domain-containing protein, partial [Leucobacter sp.]
MADIIVESGLSAGAIYGYFEGKQQLLNEVAEHVLMARVEQIEVAGSGGGSPVDLVMAFLDLLDEKGPNELPVQLWSEA